MNYLCDTELDMAALEDSVADPAAGAVVSFCGRVRDHHQGRSVVGLRYTAFGPMAEKECGAIVEEARGTWPVRVALAHRTGELNIGDPAVFVAVAGAHRAEAFAACRFVIEEVKRRVPIWKLERYQDGSEAWVDPTAPAGTVPAVEQTASASGGGS